VCPVLTLTGDDLIVTLDPVQGGRISSIVAFGEERLVSPPLGDPAPRPSSWGAFPMIPWAGRIQHGKFTFDGVDYEMPINHPPHAMHGIAYTSEWTALDANTMRLDLADPWRFGGHAIHHGSVEGNSATFRLEVHAADRPMPAMAGWHPWYRKPVDLSFTAAKMYERDDEDIPTGQLVDPPPGPWDDTFTGLAGPPSLRWPDGVTATISSTCDHWVIFTQPDHALCVEPQTGPPNEFNMKPQVVAPGAPLIAEMTLAFTRSAP
jgi:aldose 1-epimerase